MTTIRTGLLASSIAVAALALASCGSPPDEAGAQAPPEVAATEATTAPATETAMPTPAVVALSSADKGRMCRAIIASLNGRDPGIIRVISEEAGVHRVRYTRDDGTVWTNECRVADDGSAQWRAILDGEPGRWRTEDTIRYTVEGSTVGIATFMDGEPMTSDTYTLP